MGSVYARWKTLWLKHRDETGKAVSRSSGYKLGQEAEARGLLAELEKRVAEAVVPPVATRVRAQQLTIHRCS